ncbi:proline dehydrogenase [Deinococcus irradiatisoli]|uniref:proline dehydrogenase n=1 Tax=Deinococcus irradiatisoli TaxID=2202254 RepID=A0A2Z3JH65_9DEIO|nr:proline dehydrogenase family protein [Deinococcus irradiatisoli]AWN22861.1 proline dehydrogenase [Deinococcus irradiatisoli]
MIDQIYRKTVLTVAGNKSVEALMRSRGWSLAQRFVAGEQASDVIGAVQELQKDGIGGILDLLGEFVDSVETANAFAEQILALMDQAAAAGIKPYVSVKLSGIGQGMTVDGQDLGLTNARRLLTKAAQYGGFLALDMEDHPRVDVTLAQFRTLVEEFGHAVVGTVLQSYLYRTEADLQALGDLRPNLRIVKGAYLEPPSVAMPDKADVDASYRKLVYANLKAGHYTNVATHDESIIDDVKMFVLSHGIPRSQFEFQLLYGVRRDLQKKLAAEGYTVRAYIPYGRDWYAYFSRRIAERPGNALFVLRGLLKG